MKKLFILSLISFIPTALFCQSVYTNVFEAKQDIKKGSLISVENVMATTKQKQVNIETLEEFKTIEELFTNTRFKLFASQDILKGDLITPQNTAYTAFKKPVLDRQIKPDTRLYALPTPFNAEQKIKAVDILFKSDGQLKTLAANVKVLGKRRIKKKIIVYIQTDPLTIQKICSYREKGTLAVKISDNQSDK